MKPHRTIAIVEDDDGMRLALSRLLQSESYTTVPFADAEDYLRWTNPDTADCLIVDVHLPGMNGVDLVRTLVARRQRVAAVLTTAHDDRATRALIASTALPHLRKPFSDDELFAALERAMAAPPLH